MIQENDVVPSDFVVGDVSVSRGEVLEEQDRICRAKAAESEPEKIALEAGREAVVRLATRIASIIAGRGCHAFSVCAAHGSMHGQPKLERKTFSRIQNHVGILNRATASAPPLRISAAHRVVKGLLRCARMD